MLKVMALKIANLYYDTEILNGIQRIIVNAEYGSTVLTRKPTIGTKDIYVIRIIKHTETYIKNVTQVDYDGVIWCPHQKTKPLLREETGRFSLQETPHSLM
jgi:hypothetical protein